MNEQPEMIPGAIELKTEFIPPDMGMVYAQLAPLVSEAHAYLSMGKTKIAMKLLDEAHILIELTRTTAMTPGCKFTTEDEEPEAEGDG